MKNTVYTLNFHKETVYVQFQNTIIFYETEGIVLARHLIHSFLLDELTPELANKKE